MLTAFAALVLVLGIPTDAQDETSIDRYTAELQKIMAEQQDFLESELGVVFTQKVGVTFGLPPGMKIEDSSDKDAWYILIFSEIRVNPVYKYMVHDPDARLKLSMGIRHELGHAFANQASEELKQGEWPPPARVLSQPFSDEWRDRLGYAILGEGIGRVFERFGTDELADNHCDFDEYVPGENIYIPQKLDDMSWRYRDLFVDIVYEGGFCLARPIIEAHGIAGVEYIVTHPLMFEDWDLRSAIKAYVRDATKSLSH